MFSAKLLYLQMFPGVIYEALYKTFKKTPAGSLPVLERVPVVDPAPLARPPVLPVPAAYKVPGASRGHAGLVASVLMLLGGGWLLGGSARGVRERPLHVSRRARAR